MPTPRIPVPRKTHAALTTSVTDSARNRPTFERVHTSPSRTSDSLDTSTSFHADRVSCLLITILSILGGMLLMRLLWPNLPDSLPRALLASHLPGDTHPLLVFLRLCAARLPIYAWLAASGLTRFSGGLTSAVLAYRGLSDGAALYLLYTWGQEDMAMSADPATSALYITVAYTLWMMLDCLARHWLAFRARRFARETARADKFLPTAHIRYLLWRYLAAILISLTVSIAGCGLYVWLLTELPSVLPNLPV